MVSFLHTADWQLGQTLRMVGPSKAEYLRSARLTAVRNLLELGEELNVDFVVSAGDNFESNQVGRELLRDTKSILEDFPDLPIYIIPGNHDPLMEDYAFRNEPLNSVGNNVHLLTREQPVEVPNTSAVLYPGICRKKKSSQSPLDWVPKSEKDDRIRIGLAHGSWMKLPDLPKDDYPIGENAAEKYDLDYLALGHWHSTFPDPEGPSSRRTFYSGTPEPTGFNESDSGNVLLVETDSSGDLLEVEKHEVGQYGWIVKECTLSDTVSVDGLKDDLNSTSYDEGNTLLRLKPEGTIPLKAMERFEGLTENLEDSFFYLDVRDEGLDLAPSEQEVEELVAGTGWLGDAVEYLEKLASGEIVDPPEKWKMDDPPTKKEAQRALEILYGRLQKENL